MALKATLATKADVDALPEATRSLYTEKDGKFVLDVEGGLASPTELQDLKTKVSTFRDERTAAVKERDDLKALVAKFDGIDPDEHKALKAEKEKFKKKGAEAADDIDAIVAKALKPIQDALVAEKEQRQAAQREADQARFRQLFSADATKAGVRASALEFVLPKAEAIFELKDGALAAREGTKHPTDADKVLTSADWLQHLAKTSEYLFEPSTGGGANGNGGSGGRPGAKQLINPTPEEAGRHMDAIAKGEMVVVRS